MMIQGSASWFAARIGKVTASRIADLMAKTKTGYSTSRNNYLAELLTERLTGVSAPCFINDAMRHGTEQEPYARLAYSAHKGVDVFEVGFVDHPEISMSGASPDGYVDDDGLVEIKCPNTATHIETLLGEAIPNKYVLQMQWQMACTGRKWCDFASFDPRLPERMQLHVQRVNRDSGLIVDIESEVTSFLVELDAKVNALTDRYGA